MIPRLFRDQQHRPGYSRFAMKAVPFSMHIWPGTEEPVLPLPCSSAAAEGAVGSQK
jgi:hypothetical protein